MRSAYRFDHIVIVVDDLEAAAEDYRALGFTVVPGGAHADAPTHNMLIGLADDTYLELIAFRRRSDPGLPLEERLAGAGSLFEAMLLRWEWVGRGLAHYALLPQDIDADLQRAQQRGIDMEGPAAGSRRRPDGQMVAWEVGIPDSLDLPFFCADVTPRGLRVPSERDHTNGVAGVDGIVVAVSELAIGAIRYHALLGVQPRRAFAPEVPGAHCTAFQLASGLVTLAEPTDEPEAEPLREHLATRGEGPYALRLRGPHAGELDAGRTGGAPITVVVE